jgi:hypothetical protein
MGRVDLLRLPVVPRGPGHGRRMRWLGWCGLVLRSVAPGRLCEHQRMGIIGIAFTAIVFEHQHANAAHAPNQVAVALGALMEPIILLSGCQAVKADPQRVSRLIQCQAHWADAGRRAGQSSPLRSQSGPLLNFHPSYNFIRARAVGADN